MRQSCPDDPNQPARKHRNSHSIHAHRANPTTVPDGTRYQPGGYAPRRPSGRPLPDTGERRRTHDPEIRGGAERARPRVACQGSGPGGGARRFDQALELRALLGPEQGRRPLFPALQLRTPEPSGSASDGQDRRDAARSTRPQHLSPGRHGSAEFRGRQLERQVDGVRGRTGRVGLGGMAGSRHRNRQGPQ